MTKPHINDYDSGDAWKDEMNYYQDSIKYIDHIESQNKELIEIPVNFLQWIIDFDFKLCESLFYHWDDYEGQNPITPKEIYLLYKKNQ